jgi:protein tyrosine/serine phosphatase
MEYIYWVTPFLGGRCGPQEHAWDLPALYRSGIKTIVSLDENINEESITSCGFHHFPLYLPDVALTTDKLLHQFLDAVPKFISIVTSCDDPVLVHCHAGNDRTGAMLTCFLISQGIPVDKAISRVKKLNQYAMATPGYEKAVYMFAEQPSPVSNL